MFKYVLLAFLPILIACSKEEPAQDIIIDFSGNNNVLNEIVKAGAGSSMVNTDAELQDKSFGVYGLRSGTNSNFVTPVFETSAAKQVSYGGGAWGYTPKAKWVRSNYYRFRAYWPYEEIFADDLINSGSDANLLSLSYSSGVQNYDLQIAYAERYPDATPRNKNQIKKLVPNLWSTHIPRARQIPTAVNIEIPIWDISVIFFKK